MLWLVVVSQGLVTADLVYTVCMYVCGMWLIEVYHNGLYMYIGMYRCMVCIGTRTTLIGSQLGKGEFPVELGYSISETDQYNVHCTCILAAQPVKPYIGNQLWIIYCKLAVIYICMKVLVWLDQRIISCTWLMWEKKKPELIIFNSFGVIYSNVYSKV